MAREWYILHTYSGYENKVEKFIRSYMEDPEFSKTVLDIKVPTEEVTIEGKDGKKKTYKLWMENEKNGNYTKLQE